MRVFTDTSAFYAWFLPEDAHHTAADKAFEHLEQMQAQLVTTNYILLECTSLIQRRHGFSYARSFLSKTIELLHVIWIDELLHKRAMGIWSESSRRDLSLVDCTSFAAMRQAGIRQALAFDPHFEAHGFEVVP